jgi:MFS family permease
MLQWGRASDRIGRKPVLVFSLAGVAIATAIFGLSKTLWQMVLLRCCAGVFAGTIV